MKWLTRSGAVITAAAAIGVGALIYWKRDLAATMTLNEWGDFLAGLSAPLALLWLVIGYFQQGKELQHNTEALKAQQEELRRQVEETAALAKNAERQAAVSEKTLELTLAEQQRQARLEKAGRLPKFVFPSSTEEGNQVRFDMENAGATARDVELVADFDRDFLAALSPQGDLAIGDRATLTLGEVQEKPVPFPVFFQIAFRGTDGEWEMANFICHGAGWIEQVEPDDPRSPASGATWRPLNREAS